LKASTNNKWKANGPSTAISNLNISFKNNSSAFGGAFIDATTFDCLKENKVEEFWRRRADSLANTIEVMQSVN
jgi:S-formylglutathione hydrolase FrmB